METTIEAKNNPNLEDFAKELGEITGQWIGLDHIHPTYEGRFYYTQPPKAGVPMILHHYRGPFFVDIHPNDYKKITSGEVSAHQYITTARWCVGYFWGAGSMIGGGYYQPVDIIGRQEDVRRYLAILECRGFCLASRGCKPSEQECSNCSIESCPFSEYKGGNWELEQILEPDPRIDFFHSLCESFKEKYPGYTLQGFLCGEIPEGEIMIMPNGRFTEQDPASFTAYAPSAVIQSILLHEVEPESWAEYVSTFSWRVTYANKTEDVTEETLAKAIETADHTKKVAIIDDIDEGRPSIIARIVAHIKKFF